MKAYPKQFDIVMANLKFIEPSVAFDLEFKRRLQEAVAKKLEESFFERLSRRALEGLDELRYALMPRIPALARIAATAIFMITASYYIYSIQPSLPISISREGVVTVQEMPGREPQNVSAGHKFKEGDIITTQNGAYLDMGVSSKYTVRIKEASSVKIVKLPPRYGAGKADFKLVEGKMLINIDEGFKGSKFIVDTDEASATALGTKFSVDTSRSGKPKTGVSVLEGKVSVKGSYAPGEEILLAKQSVVVGAGQKTEVLAGDVPQPPQRLMEEEWRSLEELYQIGRKPQVILLLKNTPDRVKQLLRPCPIYISDEKPRDMPVLLEKAVLKIKEAIETHDPAKHLEGIKILEKIVQEHPNAKYNAQLMLYIGAYYEYISYHKQAIRAFEKVIIEYPNSTLASIAQCAIGVIYEEKLNDPSRANAVYRLVLDKYPNSLEAIWAEEKLGIKKVS
jgi:tetratricopeptide (TPR) repeat protein